MKVDIPDDMLDELNYWFKKNYGFDFKPSNIGELIANYIKLRKQVDAIENVINSNDF